MKKETGDKATRAKDEGAASTAVRAVCDLTDLRHSVFITDAEQRVLDRAAKICARVGHEARNGGKRRRQ